MVIPSKTLLFVSRALLLNWRSILYAAAFFVSSACYAEFRLAVINDPDGYTNVREAPDPKSDVVFKVEEDEFFLCEEGKGSWWKAKDFFQNTGFIHKSRVRFYHDLSDTEKNPQTFTRNSVRDYFQNIETHPLSPGDFFLSSYALNRDRGQILSRESPEGDGVPRWILFNYKDPPNLAQEELANDQTSLVAKILELTPPTKNVFKSRRGIALGQNPDRSLQAFGKPHKIIEKGDLEILHWEWSFDPKLWDNPKWLEKDPSFWRSSGFKEHYYFYKIRLFFRKKKLIGLDYYFWDGGCC